MYTGFWWGNLKGRVHLGDPGVDGRIILKRTFRNCRGYVDMIDLAQEWDRWRALVNAAMNLRVP